MNAFRKIVVLAVVVLIIGVFANGAILASEALDADEVMQRSEEAVLNLSDITTEVQIIQVEGRRENEIKARFSASLKHKVARVEIDEPSALRGQIIVADQALSEVRMYLPITNQILIRGFADMGEEVGLTLDLTDLQSLFDFSQFEVEIKEIINTEAKTTYVLEVTGLEDSIQYVWIDSANWLPFKLEIHQRGKLQGRLTFEKIALDQGLLKEDLIKLPRAREIRQ